MNLSTSQTVPNLLLQAGLADLSRRVRNCRTGSLCNQRLCPRCAGIKQLSQRQAILKYSRKVNPSAVPQFVTLTIGDVPVLDTHASLLAVMKSAGQIFRSFPHYGVRFAGQVSPGIDEGYVHPHIHGLLWQGAEIPEWQGMWRDAIERNGAGLIEHCADVQEARNLEATASYISRGPLDLQAWADRLDDLVEVVPHLKGLRLFGTVQNS